MSPEANEEMVLLCCKSDKKQQERQRTYRKAERKKYVQGRNLEGEKYRGFQWREERRRHFTAGFGLQHEKSSRNTLRLGKQDTNKPLGLLRTRWPFSWELVWKERKKENKKKEFYSVGRWETVWVRFVIPQEGSNYCDPSTDRSTYIQFITNSSCAAKPCSNKQMFILNSSAHPKVYKDTKYVRLNFGNVSEV